MRKEERRLEELRRKVSAEIMIINSKMAWLESRYRYGDILQVLPPFKKEGPGKKYVVVSYKEKGLRIKNDGTLYKETSYIPGMWGMSSSRVSLVGRYDGDDLPAPDEAALFGMKNR